MCLRAPFGCPARLCPGMWGAAVLPIVASWVPGEMLKVGGQRRLKRGFARKGFWSSAHSGGAGSSLGTGGPSGPLICPDFSCAFTTRGVTLHVDGATAVMGQPEPRGHGGRSLQARCEVPCAPLQSPLDPVGTSQHHGGGGAECGGRLKPRLGRHGHGTRAGRGPG